jgi:hypothetical protein
MRHGMGRTGELATRLCSTLASYGDCRSCGAECLPVSPCAVSFSHLLRTAQLEARFGRSEETT